MQQAGEFRVQQDLRRAGKCYDQILRILPDFVPALADLSQCRARLKDEESGIRLAERAVKLKPFDAHLHANLADLYLMNGEPESAAASAQRALEIKPDEILAYVILARISDHKHDYGKSIEHLKRALNNAPSDPNLLISLAQAYRFNKQIEEAKNVLEKLLEREDVAPGIRVGAVNEMGMVYDKLKKFDDAFQMFAEYGRLTSASALARDWHKETHLDRIRDYRSLFGDDPRRLRRFTGDMFTEDRNEHPELAFLVGFPRSGTTMTEQVLDAHRDVTAIEEPPYLTPVKKKWREIVAESDDVEAMFNRLDKRKILQLRRFFWSVIEDDLGSEAVHKFPTFVFKHPLLINELPLLNTLFPDAKFIVALRDPRDCCLSCFMQDFGLNAGMIHFLDLRDTCRFYHATFDLYLSIRDHLAADLIEIRYEDTVSNLEKQARRILDHLGLVWDPAVLEFHKRSREKFINTPSFTAVNEPVNTQAVARWKGYAKHFEPYMELLEPFVREFGYEQDD